MNVKKIEHITKIHGVELKDDYYWMRNIESDPDVKKYLNEQNVISKKVMESHQETIDLIFDEMKSRKVEEYDTYLAKDGEYYYFERYEKGNDYQIHCRKKGLQGEVEIVLDENQLAKGHESFSIGNIEVSPDHKLLAYSFDLDGKEEFEIRVLNLESGELFEDVITGASGDLCWYNDNQTLLYTALDNNHRPDKVFRHTLGTKQEADELIYTESSSEYFLDLTSELNKSYIFIRSSGSMDSEYHYLNANNPTELPTLFAKRTKGVEYYVGHREDQFFILTNLKHTNFSLMTCKIDQHSKEDWQELIVPGEGEYLNDFSLFADYFITHIRGRDGLKRFFVYDKQMNKREIPLSLEAYCLYEANNSEFVTETYYYEISGLSQPRSVYAYNMKTGENKRVKVYDCPGFDESKYVVKRVWVNSHDQKRIPMSLFYKKELSLDGKAPVYLYGYGSYGSNIDPSFDSDVISLVDRGFIFAIAHVRGSSTLGRQWYEDGKFLNKKNTFKDFISCTEFLVENKYTSKGQVAIQGVSAGGMLVGASMNMAADLFKCVIANVPFVDVMNTMLDSSLPLTQLEYNEWGNPEKDKEYFDYMLSYSPYDNIERKDYPHILSLGGINDHRVTYWEPSKFHAKLNDYKTNDNMNLLKTNMDSGHFGATGRFEYLKEEAFIYGFILKSFDNT